MLCFSYQAEIQGSHVFAPTSTRTFQPFSGLVFLYQSIPSNLVCLLLPVNETPVWWGGVEAPCGKRADIPERISITSGTMACREANCSKQARWGSIKSMKGVLCGEHAPCLDFENVPLAEILDLQSGVDPGDAFEDTHLSSCARTWVVAVIAPISGA